MNHKIFYALNSLAGQNAFLDSLIIFLAKSLPWILIIFVFVYFVLIKKRLRVFSMILVCLGFSAFVSETLKWAIFRHPRPFAALPDVVQLIQISSFDSYPSTHATIFAALATIMFMYKPRFGWIFAVSAVLIGLARIAAGIHFPWDVLTGFVIGILITIIAYSIWYRFTRYISKLIS